MIQLVVNVNLLREIDERKLINAYARHVCETIEDLENDIRIKENLKQLLDWDENGQDGLGVYCSKFESIKRNDWETLINFIKQNKNEIERLSKFPNKQKQLEHIKIINDIKRKNLERLSDKNYEVSNRGIKARSCIYEGKKYKSRSECIAKEGISNYKLYEYLKKTNQL